MSSRRTIHWSIVVERDFVVEDDSAVDGLAIRVCGGRRDDPAGEDSADENPGDLKPELDGLVIEVCDGAEGEVRATRRMLVDPGLDRETPA